MSDCIMTFDAAGQLCMLVIDAQNANDKAWNPPPGGVKITVPKTAYNFCADQISLLQLAQPAVAQASPIIGTALQNKITAMQTAAAAATTPTIPTGPVIDPVDKDGKPI